MSVKAKVNWRLDKVKATLKDANEEVLKKFAYRIVQRTQENIRDNDQIDTGFMVNSIYPIWKDGSDYASVRAQASSHRTGMKSGRSAGDEERMAPEARLEEKASAAVVVGANYAIYQESRLPFLWPAAERSAAEFGGTAERIYKENIHD